MAKRKECVYDNIVAVIVSDHDCGGGGGAVVMLLMVMLLLSGLSEGRDNEIKRVRNNNNDNYKITIRYCHPCVANYDTNHQNTANRYGKVYVVDNNVNSYNHTNVPTTNMNYFLFGDVLTYDDTRLCWNVLWWFTV